MFPFYQGSPDAMYKNKALFEVYAFHVTESNSQWIARLGGSFAPGTSDLSGIRIRRAFMRKTTFLDIISCLLDFTYPIYDYHACLLLGRVAVNAVIEPQTEILRKMMPMTLITIFNR